MFWEVRQQHPFWDIMGLWCGGVYKEGTPGARHAMAVEQMPPWPGRVPFSY